MDGRAGDPGALVRAGQTIVWHRPPWTEPEVPTDFEVLHEDAAIVAVRKPSGLPTMPAGGFLENTLLAMVRQRYPGCSPLHRLGRHTSGIVLLARTPDAAAVLSKAWREREVKKHYRALGSGISRSDLVVIDASIGPVSHPLLGQIEAALEEGKPSHTVAMVLERRENSTLFGVEITTGRPHQIRIHLAYAGHPLVGDSIYQVGGVIQEHPGLPGDGGYWLHAEGLQFVHPLTREPIELYARPPEKLLTCAESLVEN